MNAQSLYWWHLETEIQFRGRQWAHESCLGVVQSIFDILKIYYTKPNDPMNSIHRSEVKRVKRTLRLRTNQWSWVLNKISRIGPLNNVCGMLPGPHWLRILPRFFFFFFFFFLLLFLHSFFHLYSVLVVVVLYSFAIPKPRSEVVAARDKSSTRRGVSDTTNVSVVTWKFIKRSKKNPD